MKKGSIIILLMRLTLDSLNAQDLDSIEIQLDWIQQELIFDDVHVESQKKINLNQKDLSELQKLSFITKSDIERILLYRSVNGYFLNVLELSKVEGFSGDKFKRIQSFVEAIPVSNNVFEAKHFQHEIIAKWRRTWSNLAVTNASSPWSEQFRYRGLWGNHWKMGFCTTKDGGEQLATQRYWFKSGFLIWSSSAKRWSILAGDYSVLWGQGGLISRGFLQSANWNLNSMFQNKEGFFPYQSTIENLQKRGVVFHYKSHRALMLMGISSLAVHGQVDSLNEFVLQSVSVFDDSLSKVKWKMGRRSEYFLLTRYQIKNGNFGVAIHGDTTLENKSIYSLVSPNYGFSFSHVKGAHHVSGELAICKDRTNIVIGGLFSPHPKWQWGFFFDRSWQPFFAFFNSDHRKIQGEWKVHPKHTFMFGWNQLITVADREGLPLRENSFFIQWNYQPQRNYLFYYRCIKKQPEYLMNDGITEKVNLYERNSHRVDANLAFHPELSLHGRMEWLWDNRLDRNGQYAFLELDIHPYALPFKLIARYTFFNAADWELRQYVQERGVAGSFYIPALYGRGSRQYLIISGKWKSWNIQVKYSVFSYQGSGGNYRWTGHLRNENNTSIEVRIAYELSGFVPDRFKK